MQEDNSLNRLLLLPDERSLPKAEEGFGLIGMPSGLGALKEAGEAMRPAEIRETAVPGTADDPSKEPLWRGVLALALLCDVWADAPELRTVACTPGTSVFAKAALQAAGAEILRLIAIGQGAEARVLALTDDSCFLRLPATREDFSKLLPARATWYDAATRLFDDPCAQLCERDRHTLADRLALLPSERTDAFRTALITAELTAAEDAVSGSRSLDWETAVKAVAGLAPELTGDELTTRELPYRERSANALLSAIGLPDARKHLWEPQLIYLWRGVPFAVSSTLTGVQPLPGFDFTGLRRECILMEENSRRYARELADRLERYTLRQSNGFMPEAREQIRLWIEAARQKSELPAEPLTLTWPWDHDSPAVSLLMGEALGETLRDASMAPFSDRLCMLRGGQLGDRLLQQRCAMFFGDEVYTALPPISDRMAEFTARHGWSGRGIDPDSLTLTADEAGVSVSMLLKGTGRVLVNRRYEDEEILPLEDDAIPQVSLWPAVPLPRERWHLYHVSCKGRAELRLLKNDEWTVLPQPEDPPVPEVPDTPEQPDPQNGAEPAAAPAPVPLPWRALRTDALPSCISVWIDGSCAGALYCRPAPFTPPEKGVAVAAIDIGASGTAMSLSLNGQVLPVSMPSLRFAAVRGLTDDLSGDPLPAWPIEAVIPSCVELSAGADDAEPFLSGRVCPEQAIDDLMTRGADLVCDFTDRSSRTERARVLLRREAMLLCAFHAVMCGARSIAWRVVLPNELTLDRRRATLDDFRHDADRLSVACGLMQALGLEPAGLRENLAIGMELRENSALRGGYAMLSIGPESTLAMVWLRGMNRPAAEFSVPLGIRTLLLPALEQDPQLFCRELSALPLSQADLTADDSGKNCLLCDRLTGRHLTTVMSYLNVYAQRGQMTRTLALLLFGFARWFTMAGMTLEQLWQNPLLNDYLPPELFMAMGGPGSDVLAAMDQALRSPMLSFARLCMSPEHPVRSLRLTPIGDTQRSAATGLCKLRAMPEKQLPPTVLTNEPMPMLPLTVRFLAQFNAAWPGASALVLPGIFGQDGSFTQEAQQLITSAVYEAEGDVYARFASASEEICRLSMQSAPEQAQ